jgi:hypothetical protein
LGGRGSDDLVLDGGRIGGLKLADQATGYEAKNSRVDGLVSERKQH